MARARCLGYQSQDADPISIRIRDNGYQISRVCELGAPWLLDLQRELLHLGMQARILRPAPCQSGSALSAPAIEPVPRMQEGGGLSSAPQWLPADPFGTLLAGSIKSQGEGINE